MKTTAGRQARVRPDQAAASSAVVGSSDKRSEPWPQNPPAVDAIKARASSATTHSKDRLIGRVRFPVHAKLPKWLESLNMFRTAVGKEIMPFGSQGRVELWASEAICRWRHVFVTGRLATQLLSVDLGQAADHSTI